MDLWTRLSILNTILASWPPFNYDVVSSPFVLFISSLHDDDSVDAFLRRHMWKGGFGHLLFLALSLPKHI
jgi:hypothetical protein